MRILRHLVLGGITGLGAVVICFVAADRVAHTTLPVPAIVAKAVPAAEPQTTGTVTQGADTPEPKLARRLDGFDTERLNALMRGEMPPPPASGKTAARKR